MNDTLFDLLHRPLDVGDLMKSVDTDQIVASDEVVSRRDMWDVEFSVIVRMRFCA